MKKNYLLHILLVSTIFWLNGCAVQPLNLNIPADEPGQNHLKNISPEVIIVLGSGSARGFSHVGVLKVLEENHIPIDMIVGTSAGSIVGVLYADKPSMKSLHHILMTAKQEEVIDFSWFNIVNGPVSGIGIQKFLITNLHAKDFNQLKIPFVAVATDLESGKIHVFGSGPIAPAINASCAVPPYFPPVKLYHRTYIDGGLIDPVAVDVAKRFKPKVIIAVKLDYPLGKTLPTRSPSVFLRGVDIMLLQLTTLSAKQADIIITPETGDLSIFDSLAREKSMKAGEDAARKALPAIRKLLKQKGISLK